MASHSMLKLVDPSQESRRTAVRNRLLMVAKLATSAHEIDVRIRDVSTKGARLEGCDQPPVGTDVILKRGAFEGFGQVVWSRGDAAGIQFDEWFEEAELMTWLRGIAPPVAPDPELYRRPGFNCGGGHPKLSTGRGWVSWLPAARS